jgi:hypothetical protein
MKPLEELRRLGVQIEAAPGLDTLKPIYDRLDEISRHHSNDFEVQLVVADLREHLVHRGVALRRMTNGNGAPPTAEKKPLNLRKALMIGAGLGVLGWLVLFVTLVQVARNRNMTPGVTPPATSASSPPAAGTVPVDIITTPPGATIQINNDTKCTSNCRVNLAPGNYQVTAMLDGYDPAATGVTVIPGAPINVTLSLLNQAQSVRIYTDLPSGKVFLDGAPAPDLQDGQLVLDRVKNGKHSLRVIGPTGEASFAFNLVAGKAPAIEGPISALNLLAVLVGSFGGNAIVQSNSAPVKVSLNGQPQGVTSPAGLELKNVSTGDQQLAIGEGADERKMVVTFGSMPALTAYLKSDINSGTLVVSTGEDDVSVFLNGKEYRRKTRRGQLRIPIVGPVKVRVAKEGFQTEGEQAAEVKKGEETRLAFRLRPLPQVASLQVRGAAPGTQLVIDERIIGRVGADGTLSAANLIPGDRVIELRREGYLNKRMTRTLKSGETLVLNGGDVALAAAAGTLHLLLSPPDAQVTYRRSDETQSHLTRDAALRLDPGVYVFTAKAPGHLERTEKVPVVAGETRNVELALAREKVETPKPNQAPVAAASDWNGWNNEGGEFVRRGGGRVPVHTGPLNGTLTFTAHLRKGGGLFRGGKLRWFIDDGDKTSQFEIDKKHFYAKDSIENEKLEHENLDQKKFTVQVEITPDRIVQRLRVDGRWVVLASQAGRSIPNGRFGFIIPGGDEIAVSDFHFTPR